MGSLIADTVLSHPKRLCKQRQMCTAEILSDIVPDVDMDVDQGGH